jgi:NADPH:quinone reductase
MTEIPRTRRVAYARAPGGPDVLQVAVENLPSLKAGEVLVRVAAAGLNHVEGLIRTDAYSIRIPFPYAVGFEGAGVVVAAGPEVDLVPGTRVCWTAVFGSCATFVVAPASMLALLPDEFSYQDGASLAHAGVTAAGLVRHWPLEPGASAVVWGAAGTVGLVLVAYLSERGVRVIGIATGERVHAVRAAGATEVVDRANADINEAVRAATGGRGASAVFDPVGVATYRTSLRLLAPRGCLVNYGQLSGALPSIDLLDVMEAGSVFVTKYGPRAGLVGPQQVGAFVSEALTLAAKRRLAPVVAGRFTLDRVVEAYRELESNGHGKVLVIPHMGTPRGLTTRACRARWSLS